MLRQISLQKRGAATIDSFELHLALKEIGVEHQVFLSTGNSLRHRWDQLGESGDKVCWLNTYKRSIGSFVFSLFSFRWLKLLNKLKKGRSEAILATHFHPWLFFIAILKKNICGRLIYIVHENPFEPKEDDSRLMLCLQKFVLKRADILITHSRSLKTSIEKKVQVKIFSFSLGAYNHYCSNLFFTKNNSDFTFLFLGRIEPYKGVDLLMKAFVGLPRQDIGMHLIIAGEGRLPSICCPKIETINRWLSDEEVCDLFSRADVLVLPYLKASQSGVLSMAWACGVPVIVSNVEGLTEQVKNMENGLVFKSGDISDLSKVMFKIARERDLFLRLKKGAEKAGKESYTWRKVALGVKDVLSK